MLYVMLTPSRSTHTHTHTHIAPMLTVWLAMKEGSAAAVSGHTALQCTQSKCKYIQGSCTALKYKFFSNASTCRRGSLGPSVLSIWLSWSRSDLPGHSGRPVSNSQKTQPTAHTSTGGPAAFARSIAAHVEHHHAYCYTTARSTSTALYRRADGSEACARVCKCLRKRRASTQHYWPYCTSPTSSSGARYLPRMTTRMHVKPRSVSNPNRGCSPHTFGRVGNYFVNYCDLKKHFLPYNM